MCDRCGVKLDVVWTDGAGVFRCNDCKEDGMSWTTVQHPVGCRCDDCSQIEPVRRLRVIRND